MTASSCKDIMKEPSPTTHIVCLLQHAKDDELRQYRPPHSSVIKVVKNSCILIRLERLQTPRQRTTSVKDRLVGEVRID